LWTLDESLVPSTLLKISLESGRLADSYWEDDGDDEDEEDEEW